MVTKDANSQGIDAEKYCLKIYDDATRFTMAYPVGHRNATDSLEALRDYEGPDPVIKSIYIDGAPEFVKMCKRIRPEGICHPTSTPGVSSSNARAERRNRHVLEGARTALDRAGVGVKMWPYVVKHWCFAETLHIYEGDFAYRKRFGVWCKAKEIPFGALIDFRPPKSLEKKLPKMGPRGIPGIHVGYRMQPGGMGGRL